MGKIKYTKNELKKQKDDLKRYLRYLPTLELKKRQLLQEINRVQIELEEVNRAIRQTDEQVAEWVAVFGEAVEWESLFEVKDLLLDYTNIAGVNIPLFKDLNIEVKEYDLATTPLWVDSAIDVLTEQLKRRAKAEILQQQESFLRNELRITIQRIKLFEEVKIPQARENIRTIQIFLGDQMTAEVVRGKIAKAKLLQKKQGEQSR
jgi:V/A-type H+-transporting ATPase subunit D